MSGTLARFMRFLACYDRADDLGRDEQKAYHVSCLAAALAATVTLVPIVLSMWLRPPTEASGRMALFPNLSAVAVYGFCWWLLRNRRVFAGKVLLLGEALTHMTMLVIAFGLRSGVHYFYFAAFTAPLIVFTRKERRAQIALMVLTTLVFLAVNYYYLVLGNHGLVFSERSTSYVNVFFMFNAVLALAILGGFVFHFYHVGYVAEEQLEAERTRSERLLLNILPGPIAERLKNGDILIADRYEEATVLFADIVGFTPLSARLSPDELVAMLNAVFTDFDRMAEQFGVEKIKTIGDAYMVAGGVPEHTPDHALQVAQMALAMQKRMRAESNDRSLELRIGLHSGPVVAGVIGTRKFIYDLWGDTVNTAARMEAHGLPGRIHVSSATRDQLKDRFAYERRGVIEIKGKGPMETFFLVDGFDG